MSAALLAAGGPVIPNFGQSDKCMRTNGTFSVLLELLPAK
jgi:hypothetical protein